MPIGITYLEAHVDLGLLPSSCSHLLYETNVDNTIFSSYIYVSRNERCNLRERLLFKIVQAEISL